MASAACRVPDVEGPVPTGTASLSARRRPRKAGLRALPGPQPQSIDGPLAGDSVYLARSDTGEWVAIKVFRSRSAAVLAQIQEIQKVRLPDANHTVQIIDSGDADAGTLESTWLLARATRDLWLQILTGQAR